MSIINNYYHKIFLVNIKQENQASNHNHLYHLLIKRIHKIVMKNMNNLENSDIKIMMIIMIIMNNNYKTPNKNKQYKIIKIYNNRK